MRPERLGLVLIALSAVSFGGVAVLAKLALASGIGVPSVLFWRWTIAAATLAPFAIRRLRASPRVVPKGLALGALGYAGTSGVYFLSLEHAPAALASFLLYLNPVIVALLSGVLLGERLRSRGLVALATALGGLALLTLAPDVEAPPLGVALALGAAAIYAITILAGRHVVTSADPVVVAFLLSAGAAASFAAAALLRGEFALPPTAGAWSDLALLGVVSTALSIATFYYALPLIGAPRAALVSTLEPVSTVGVAFIVLGEAFTLVQGAGALLVLAAVALLATGREEAVTGEGASSRPAS